MHPAALPPLSAVQTAMLARLERQVMVWLRLGTGPRRGLERAVQKFGSMEEQLQSLLQQSHHLQSQFSPYSKPSKCQTRRSNADSSERPTSKGEVNSIASFNPERQAGIGYGPLQSGKSSSTSSLRIKPDRLVFEVAPQFDASRFLVDPLLKSGFADPRAFLKPETCWPKTKLARVQADRDDQLALYKKWDLVDSLYLLPASQSEHRCRCGLFAVYKDDRVDRQIRVRKHPTTGTLSNSGRYALHPRNSEPGKTP